ncbi:hypothetical protein PVAND_008164 [Polypedilum vanderplanki]|uniref:X-linked retinitis pigmentosa GTPase regulator-like protein n=1 Tax=Polypedilum vanderplanki TaxID=319348 RepID=A0A9J6C9D4_POLVA|nr:hypothetical protein PVAND_008164 [Polypedilum vanderplanki]
MDIPETGAVFAFGRSHLTISGDGNDNNYFFVKKDRIKKLICGQNQSAVICESGRLFVWGENPFGQLAIGLCENIVTKPSCVKVIKKLGHTVKDFQYGSNFSVLLTDSSKVFYAGKNIFPFNAKIDSLDGVFKHDVTEIPIELHEYEQFKEQFDMIRAGDEHIVVVNSKRNKLFGWGFNSHYQLAQIDSATVLKEPDVFFQTEEGESIKLLECGKISTCIVTELNNLYLTGRYKAITISSFHKLHEPIPNSTITQVCISDEDDIYLLTESGIVYKSINMKSVNDIAFEEVSFPELNDKIAKIAPGLSFLSIITNSGRCFSLLDDDKTTLIESGKLRDLNVVDINAGAQHVLVSAILRNEDENGNDDNLLLNQTYTINFKKITEMGSGVDNYQEPKTEEQLKSLSKIDSHMHDENTDIHDKNDNISLIDLEESIRGNESRATTLECKDTESSNHSSANKNSSERPNSTIRFIDNGIEKAIIEHKIKNGSVKINMTDTSEENDDDDEDEETKKNISRKKTPMPRARKINIVTAEDLDENGIIDRDEDLYDDNDDVSTSTLRGSDESLEAYINEENKINELNNSNNNIQQQHTSERFRKVKKFMSEIKDKGKGLSCKTADNVIDEYSRERDMTRNDNHKKSCSIM